MTRRSLLIRSVLVACAVLLAANIAQFTLYRTHSGNDAAAAPDPARYPLLARRIFTDSSSDILINFVPLRRQLQAKFDGLTVQKSFYFEYLPDGTSIRDGADQQLVAASLIKVPLAMNLYKAAELDRINLDQQITITPLELDNAYGDLWQKGAGYSLTLRQAARIMLEQSDNTAMHVVFDHVNTLLKYDEQSLAGLDIDQNTENGQAVITARSYSSVLKGLYYAAYLNTQDSQELLSYLTHSAATNRLAAGLPLGVPVAHKIGVDNTAWAESDCGIVYVPKRPYIICVMVGLPEDQANAFIADVSKQVYTFVVQQ